MNYVIIGASIAGVAAVEGIRSVDKEGSIIMLSDERYPAYGRPLISYYLWGKTTKEKMEYRPASFYGENGVDLHLSEKATSIDPVKKTVKTDKGCYPYDKLLIATGSSPFVPPMSGLEQVKKRFSFMTKDDAFALESELSEDKKVLVVGAGLIGLKCVEGILDRVASVTVVDLADRVLPSILDEEGSKIVKESLEEKGVSFYLNDSVAEFSENSARLKSGENVDFDLLVLAVGVRPNVSLVKEAGGEIDRGIVTDDRLATSLPDVYAAGDCATSVDCLDQKRKVLAILPNAYFQGRTAGKNMAGSEAHLTDSMPENAIGFFGLHVLTAGAYEGESYVERGEKTYKRLFVKDGVMKGFILIGDVERAGIYTAMVRTKTPVGEVDFAKMSASPALAAYSKEARIQKLAREV